MNDIDQLIQETLITLGEPSVVATPITTQTSVEPTPQEVEETTYEEVLEEETQSSIENSIMQSIGGNPLLQDIVETPPVEQTQVIEDTFKPLLASEVPDNLARFKGASWFNIVQMQEVLVAGAGGIGSWFISLLARTNPRSISVFDGDTFETHNMSGQMVNKKGVGENKAQFSQTFALEFSNYKNVSVYPQMYTEECFTAKIMVCGFDNMEARKLFFNKWLQLVHSGTVDRKECLFIDGRLLAEEFQILTIQGSDDYAISKYTNDFLFSDKDAEEPNCTLKQTSHMAAKIGATMVEFFISFCNNLNPTNNPRLIPWYHEYNSPMNITRNEY